MPLTRKEYQTIKDRMAELQVEREKALSLVDTCSAGEGSIRANNRLYRQAEKNWQEIMRLNKRLNTG